jgi:hypothetical protein
MRLSAICDEGPAQSRSQSDAIIVVGVCVGTGRLVWLWRKGRDDEIGELRDLTERVRNQAGNWQAGFAGA